MQPQDLYRVIKLYVRKVSLLLKYEVEKIVYMIFQ